MSITKEARAVVIQQLEDNPRMEKFELVELLRPHYIAEYQKLAEQDLGRYASRLAARVRDVNGARRVFANKDGDYINVDRTDSLSDIKQVYDKLVRERDGRRRSISKVLNRGAELAGQLSLDFGAVNE